MRVLQSEDERVCVAQQVGSTFFFAIRITDADVILAVLLAEHVSIFLEGVWDKERGWRCVRVCVCTGTHISTPTPTHTQLVLSLYVEYMVRYSKQGLSWA